MFIHVLHHQSALAMCLIVAMSLICVSLHSRGKRFHLYRGGRIPEHTVSCTGPVVPDVVTEKFLYKDLHPFLVCMCNYPYRGRTKERKE